MTAPLADQMATAYFALTNAQQMPEAAERLARFGYTTAKLQEGWAVYEVAKTSLSRQMLFKGKYKEATLDARAARAAAWAAYQRVAMVARAILKPVNPLFLTHLGLDQAMPRAANDFIAAATQLFAGIVATPEAAALMADYGYAPSALAAEQAVITTFRTALHEQQTAMALARRATQTQQQAFQRLGRWLTQFRMIATVAFSDEPTLLVALGFSQRGRRSNRKDAKDAKNEEEEGGIENGELRIEKNEEGAEVKEGDQAMPEPQTRTGEDDQAPSIQQQE